MYNTDLPRRADLPTSAQLRRSTIIASVSALVLLVTVVLPSEYAVDPTGIGRLFGLTQMGDIKVQLAAEAEREAALAAETPAPAPGAEAAILERLDRIEMLVRTQPAAPPQPPAETPVVSSAPQMPADSVSEFSAETVPEPVPAPQSFEPAIPAPGEATAAADPPAGRTDEASFVLPPGEGAEIKLVMAAGARANFAWTANGAVVNFDTHGDGGGQSVSYEKGRSVAEDEGVLEAAFDGNHGWFWRNRTDADVTVTVRTSGDYSDFKRMK